MAKGCCSELSRAYSNAGDSFHNYEQTSDEDDEPHGNCFQTQALKGTVTNQIWQPRSRDERRRHAVGNRQQAEPRALVAARRGHGQDERRSISPWAGNTRRCALVGAEPGFLVGSAGPKQAVPGGRGVCPLHIAASGPSWWPQQEAWEGKSSKPERSTELCAPLDIYKLKSLLKSRCLSLGSSKHLALPMGCVLWGQGALGQPLRGPQRSRRLPQVRHSHTELNSAWRLPRGQKGAPKPAGLT